MKLLSIDLRKYFPFGVALALGALFLGLQFTFWFGDQSVVTLSETREAIATETQLNEQRRERVTAMLAEVIDLKSGTDTLEERARVELGLIKEGEVFYRFADLKQY